MIRESQGRVVLNPVSVSFGVTVLGGSYTQQFNADSGEYEPDRSLTPLILIPSLWVNDPDYADASGDMTGKLVNVAWTVRGESDSGTWQIGKDYTVSDNKLTIYGNTKVDTEADIKLVAQFYDNHRGQVLQREWSHKLPCRSFTGNKFSLHSDVPARLQFSPFDLPSKIELPMQLLSNDKPVDDDKAQYVWQVLVGSSFVNIDKANRDFWYVSGVTSKTLVVDPKFIGTLVVKCTALPKAAPSKMVSEVCRIQRFYGQYMDDFVWDEGRLKFKDTQYAAGRVVVNRKAAGYVSNPSLYFDIEIFYDNDGGQGWMHVAHGDYGRVDRNLFPVDAQHRDRFGWSIRELTEVVGATVNGALVTIDGEAACLQVPATKQ